MEEDLSRHFDRLDREVARMQSTLDALSEPDRRSGASRIRAVLAKAGETPTPIDEEILEAWIVGNESSAQLVRLLGRRVRIAADGRDVALD
jgi:hypothetical protein